MADERYNEEVKIPAVKQVIYKENEQKATIW